MRDLNPLSFNRTGRRRPDRSNVRLPCPKTQRTLALTKLLVPAPHVVPEKKAKKKATGTRKSARRPDVSDSLSDESKTHSSHEDEDEEEESSPPPAGEGKKRKAAPTREAKGSKKGKTLPPDCSANASDDDEDWPPRAKPLARS